MFAVRYIMTTTIYQSPCGDGKPVRKPSGHRRIIRLGLAGIKGDLLGFTPVVANHS
jgi:hypothetical protein